VAGLIAVAEAETVTVPATVVFAEGAVMVTTGMFVSETATEVLVAEGPVVGG